MMADEWVAQERLACNRKGGVQVSQEVLEAVDMYFNGLCMMTRRCG